MQYGPGLAAAMALAIASTLVGDAIGFGSPLILAVALGFVAANSIRLPSFFHPGLRLAATRLLRLAVVLLGLRISLTDLVDIGLPGLVVVGLAVTATFFGAQILGRRLGVSPNLSLLIGTGYSICGVSAVAAMKGVIDADEGEATYAMGLVTLAGSLSIIVLPLLAGPLGLDGAAFGTWVGGAVHDVAQTVATAATGSDQSMTSAVVVKLTRVALLAPIVLGVTVSRRRTRPETGARPPLLPLFVVGFLVMVLVRSLELLPPAMVDAVKQAETFAFTVALVGVGAGVDLTRLRQLGGRPLLLGMLTWMVVAGMSYLGVMITR